MTKRTKGSPEFAWLSSRIERSPRRGLSLSEATVRELGEKVRTLPAGKREVLARELVALAVKARRLGNEATRGLQQTLTCLAVLVQGGGKRTARSGSSWVKAKGA